MARCRIVEAHVVAALLKRRVWRPLGFVRLSDYAAERLGMRARSLEEDARVVTALKILPAISAAFEANAIRWTHARLLAGIASPANEREWLRLALTSTTRRLAELVKAAREKSRGAGMDPDACAPVDVGEVGDACASADAGSVGQARTDSDACASPAANTGSAPNDSDDPLVDWSIDVTRSGRKLWRTVVDIASRMSGVDVPASRVAEAVAAEAMTWNVWEPPTPEPPRPPRTARERTDSFVSAFEALHGTSEGFPWVVAPAGLRAIDPDLERLLVDLDVADAHEVDRRLRIIHSAIQRIDAELGSSLRKATSLNVHQRLGFADFRLYCEIRLGICGAKALALMRLDRQCALRSPALLRAYREGRVTWLAATTLLSVITSKHEDAWIERAERVTLRRLENDVSWALDRADDMGGDRCQPPPPLDLDVTADQLSRIDEADIQMRAHPQTDLTSFGRRVDARIPITMPASIAALLEDAIEGCRRAVEPRWRSFERILAHAWLTWTALPQHENPVFARDHHRCQVPGCRRRGPLHSHHVWFRSRGGPDFPWNLTAVCDDHHHAFIHRGYIHVNGRAPNHLIWEVGCRSGGSPLMRLCGDVYLEK